MEKITKALEISVIAGVPCTLTPKQCAELIARIAELEAQQHWTPVTERLPEVSDWVLVRYKGVPKVFYYNAYGGFFPDKDPDYWMPLPESPNDTQKETFVYGKERER